MRAHRKSVQRWLDDLQAAGLVAHEPERDSAGRWWRTQIVLLAAPDPTAEELRIAAQRARGWRARERARRRRAGARLAAGGDPPARAHAESRDAGAAGPGVDPTPPRRSTPAPKSKRPIRPGC